MDTSKTLSDLPMDLHRLILSHDEEKIELKKENEKLKTQVKMLQCLLDEARQDIHSDSEESEDEDSEEEEEVLENLTCAQLKTRLRAINKPVGGRKADLIQRIREHERLTAALFEED